MKCRKILVQSSTALAKLEFLLPYDLRVETTSRPNSWCGLDGSYTIALRVQYIGKSNSRKPDRGHDV